MSTTNEPMNLRHLAHRIGLRAALMRATDKLGFDVVTRNFYSPVPDWRSAPSETWEKPSAMRGIAFDLDAQFARFDALSERFGEFRPPLLDRPGVYHYENGFFGALDADVLHAMVRDLKPKRVLELGSGYSSLIIGAAAERNAAEGAPLVHDVYDPYSRHDIKPRLREQPHTQLHLVSATDVPLSEFEALEAGDVLFVDTTHTVKLASDVNFVVLEVLPVLTPGVVVHVHDVFLPWEYPQEWFAQLEVFWAEQYLLQAFLSGNDAWEVLIGNAALLREDRARVARTIADLDSARFPGSFWMRAR